MSEENITKIILSWLMRNGWEIICYDFPQSGTGVLLHPNNSKEKNKDAINPDIVAVKGNQCIYFENKSYFYFPDFEKVKRLRTTSDYSEAINQLLSGKGIQKIWYGIGYPSSAHKKKAKEFVKMTDFIIGVTDEKNIEILYTVNDSVLNDCFSTI